MLKFLIIFWLFFTLSSNLFANEKKIALVLSGGGARGIAQIGVIKYLEENGIEPDYVIGTSIGSIIGGMYCSGYTSSEIDSIFKLQRYSKIFELNDEVERNELFLYQKQLEQRNSIKLNFEDFKFEIPKSLSYGNNFDLMLKEIFWNSRYISDGDFDNLKYKFRAVATDLITGNSVALSNGNLINSIKASSSIPLRFPPIKMDSMFLVDGGIKNNVPIQVAKQLGADIIIAVNTTSNLLDKKYLDEPWNIADQIVSILIKDKLDSILTQADYLITPEIGNHNNLDFSNLDSLIDEGYIAASSKLQGFNDRVIELNSKKESEFVLNVFSLKDNLKILKNSISIVGNLKIIKNYCVDLLKQNYNFLKINSINIDTNNSEIKVYVDLGNLNKIEISGGNIDRLVKRELKFKENEILSYKDIISSYQNLKNSGYFKSIDFQFEHNNPGITLHIIYEENPNQNIFLGFNVNNERGTRLNTEFYQNNIFNNGDYLSLRFNLGGRDTEVYASLENPRIRNTPLNLKITGYYKKNDIYTYRDIIDLPIDEYQREISNEYYEERYGIKLKLGSLIWKYGILSAEYRYEQQRFNFIRTKSSEFYNLSTLKLESILDTENDPYFPRKGLYFSISAESNFSTDERAKFIKSQFQLRQNISFYRFTFIPKLHFGIADNLLPLPEQFSIGGQSNFYGLREFDQRGRQYFNSGLAIRYKSPFDIFFDTYFSVRYDIGSVWLSPETIRLSSLRNGVGSAIEVDSPIGPLVLGSGRSFYFISEPNGIVRSPILIYFSVGTQF